MIDGCVAADADVVVDRFRNAEPVRQLIQKDTTDILGASGDISKGDGYVIHLRVVHLRLSMLRFVDDAHNLALITTSSTTWHRAGL